MSDIKRDSPLGDLVAFLAWRGISRQDFEKAGEISRQLSESWIDGITAPAAEAWNDRIPRGAGCENLRDFLRAVAYFRVWSDLQEQQRQARIASGEVAQNVGAYDAPVELPAEFRQIPRPTMLQVLAPILNVDLESIDIPRHREKFSALRQRIYSLIALLEPDICEAISIIQSYSKK